MGLGKHARNGISITIHMHPLPLSYPHAGIYYKLKDFLHGCNVRYDRSVIDLSEIGAKSFVRLISVAAASAAKGDYGRLYYNGGNTNNLQKK